MPVTGPEHLPRPTGAATTAYRSSDHGLPEHLPEAKSTYHGVPEHRPRVTGAPTTGHRSTDHGSPEHRPPSTGAPTRGYRSTDHGLPEHLPGAKSSYRGVPEHLPPGTGTPATEYRSRTRIHRSTYREFPNPCSGYHNTSRRFPEHLPEVAPSRVRGFRSCSGGCSCTCRRFSNTCRRLLVQQPTFSVNWHRLLDHLSWVPSVPSVVQTARNASARSLIRWSALNDFTAEGRGEGASLLARPDPLCALCGSKCSEREVPRSFDQVERVQASLIARHRLSAASLGLGLGRFARWRAQKRTVKVQRKVVRVATLRPWRSRGGLQRPLWRTVRRHASPKPS